MSSRHPAGPEIQPKTFDFTKENKVKIKEFIAKYPKGREQSAILSLLYLAQGQNDGWIPIAAMDEIAKILSIAYIRVYEVASFYSMFNLKPVGKYHIQICGTTPCWLRGSDEIKNICKAKLNIEIGETTSDNKFTLSEVECLGACSNAPMVQINDDYYEDLTAEIMDRILDDLAKDQKVKIGSQTGRSGSAPAGELTSLKERI